MPVVPGAELEVFRIVRSDYPEDSMFLDSLRSHYEMTKEPRRVERFWAVIHMGISVYVELEQALETARRFSKLGGYVAHLQLQPDRGFNYAYTGHNGHLTLWAEPVKLRDVTTDITPVSR
jgi:hypothetical protein